MPDTSHLLESVRERKSRSGIVTADRYFREVEGCFDGGFCPVKTGADSEDTWRKALKDAEKKLTYTNKGMNVLPKSVKVSKDSDFILEFDGIVTTSRRDRDGDVLETKGAKLDPRAPLLMHHMSMMPIGRRIRTLRRTDDQLKVKFGIVDSPLGRDNIPLVKAGVLRISHGFDPMEFELMDDERGFRFMKFLIFEASLVSIPANTDAVITEFSEKDFRTTLMKGWYDGVRRRVGKRKKSVATVPDDIETEEESEQVVEKSSSDSEQEPVETEEKSCECSKEIERLQKELEDLRKIEHIQKSEKSGYVVHTLDEGEFVPLESYERMLAIYEEDNKSFKDPSFQDIEREYIAELAKADTDALRKAHRRVALMLKQAEEQEEAKEWDELLSQIVN